MPALFVNGEGMRGGAVHHNVAEHEFRGPAATAPRYRLYSVRDEFPGMQDVGPGAGVSVPGELYEVPLSTLLHRFLPDEPAELELDVVELADGSAVLAMVLRPGEEHRDISDAGGWHAYRAARQGR